MSFLLGTEGSKRPRELATLTRLLVSIARFESDERQRVAVRCEKEQQRAEAERQDREVARMIGEE